MFVTAYFGMPFVKTNVLEYQNIKSDKFDGTVMPISYVPNWLDSTYSNKSLRFENISTDAFVETPRYDADLLKIDDAKNRLAQLERSTYITPYMGSYRMNFEEYDGSHLGVDIRAPLGTPVLAIANGVVVKANDKETADGKYVVLRHDDVPAPGGGTMTLYSNYLHLESLSVELGTKIRKGQPLGKVGMTGITTTPHLHFQIDKAASPFHAYWPYSTADLNALGIDFFAAVNVGLGKENAIKYTVHPLNFVQDNQTAGASQVAVVATSVAVASATEPLKASLQPSPDVSATVTENAPPAAPTVPVSTESAPKNSAPKEPLGSIDFSQKLAERPDDVLSEAKPVQTAVPASAPAVKKEKFSDVPTDAAYRPALDRLTKAGALEAFDTDDFRPSSPMTRREAAIVFGALLKLSPSEFPSLPFGDVLPSDGAAGILDRLLSAGVVGSAPSFRPNASITRAEAAVLIARASGLQPVTGRPLFRDVGASDSRKALLNAFSVALKLKKNVTFRPDAPLSRAEFVKMVDAWREKTGKLK